MIPCIGNNFDGFGNSYDECSIRESCQFKVECEKQTHPIEPCADCTAMNRFDCWVKRLTLRCKATHKTY